MSRKTQVGWIAVGVLLTLVSVGLTVKLRDGNKVVAREDEKNAEIKPSPFPPTEEATPLPAGESNPPDVTLQAPQMIDPTILRTGANGELMPARKPVDTEARMAALHCALSQFSLPDNIRQMLEEQVTMLDEVGSFFPAPPPNPILPQPPGSLTAPPPSAATQIRKQTPPVAFAGLQPEPPPLPPSPDDVKPLPPEAPSGPPPIAPAGTGKPLPPIALSDAKTTEPVPQPFERPNLPSLAPPRSIQQVKPMPDSKPDFSSPNKEVIPVSAAAKQEPGEPPMVVPAGPVQVYQVRAKTETLADIARRTLGSSERANEIVRLNPDLKPDSVLAFGATVRLPADACIQEDQDAVKPLPSLRPKSTPAKPKILPLTGTFPCNLDDRKMLTLPKGIRDQLGNCETVLVSPGPDNCLWITNHAHLERLSERIDQSPAREADIRVFKRLYYAQTEKAPVTAEGRIAISDKFAQFAGLSQELVLVGIDDHFELWDASRWKQYTQQKSAEATTLAGQQE